MLLASINILEGQFALSIYIFKAHTLLPRSSLSQETSTCALRGRKETKCPLLGKQLCNRDIPFPRGL